MPRAMTPFLLKIAEAQSLLKWFDSIDDAALENEGVIKRAKARLRNVMAELGSALGDLGGKAA